VILMPHAYLMQKTGKQWIDPKKPVVAINKAEALDWIAFYQKLGDKRVVVPLQLRLSTSGPEATIAINEKNKTLSEG
jgi:hypothetical protein